MARFANNANEDLKMDEHMSKASTQFTMELFKTALKESEGNVVVSPISVYIMLSITQQGARNNSRQQVTDALHAQPDQSKNGMHNFIRSFDKGSWNTVTKMGTRMFLRTGMSVLPEFDQTVRESFLSGTELLDFINVLESIQKINSWVDERTDGQIKELMKEEHIDPNLTLLVLVNTICFRAFWKEYFKRDSIRIEKFYVEPDVEVDAQLMYQEDTQNGGRCQEIDAKWLRLGLKYCSFSTLFILPNEKYGLNEVVQRITPEILSQLLSRQDRVKVKLWMPKFKVEKETQLIPLLKKMGVKDIFEPSTADLTGITPDPSYVSVLLQKATIEVDEEGVKAAAATGENATMCCMTYEPEEPVMEFKINHPFLMFIVDGNNAPLFAARVINPS